LAEQPVSLEELYRRHLGDGIRLAYLFCRDLATAEDLAQEAFVTVMQRLQHLRRREAFWAYYRRTLVRLAIRRAKRERARDAQVQASPAEAAWQPDLEARDEIWGALGELPQRQRVALVLRYYEDLDDGRIADLLRCRESTVRSLASRGLHALRSHLEASDDR